MFSHSIHEHVLLEEIVWATPSGMGQASSVQHGLQCWSQGTSTVEPQCYGQVSVLADCSLLRTLSGGNFLWSTPCTKTSGSGWAQISPVAAKMWLTIHMHIKASGPWPSLKSCWQGKTTVQQGTSCWRQLQRGEETLWSRSLLLEERSLEKELLTCLVKV